MYNVRQLWARLSKRYAESAYGDVHVFLHRGAVDPRSIWHTIEYPALIRNPNVTGFYVHWIGDNGSIV